MKKLTVLFLVFMMVFTSCAGKEGSNEQTSTPESGKDKSTTEGLKSNLPDNLNFDGMTLTIIHAGDPMFGTDTQEMSGDVVNDAIYKRNADVREQLNVEFEYMQTDYNIAPYIRETVLGGIDDYQIISGSQWIISPVVLENAFMNLMDGEYLDFDNPWWAENYNKEAAVGKNVRYFASGDISLSMLHLMSCMYYNKTLYENLLGDPDELYTNVVNSEWTLDAFGTIGAQCYADLNGNGTADNDDQYGYGVITANLTDHLTYDAGIRVTERDSDGIPILVLNNQKTITFTEKLYDLFYTNPGGRVFPPTGDSNDVTIPGKFINNEIMFDLGWFYTSSLFRSMEGDYGLIPYPKFDEAQEKYLSLVHDTAHVYCVPITIGNNFDTVSAVMEALAFEAYKSVTPAFYEIALKLKYIRDSDDIALQIVDMIHAGATTDFAYIYNYALNDIGLIMRALMGGKRSDFASDYAKKENGVITKLDELIKLYTSLG